MTPTIYSWFEGSTFLGTATRVSPVDNDQRGCSLAYFCQHCGEIWARAVCALPWHRIIYILCRDCSLRILPLTCPGVSGILQQLPEEEYPPLSSDALKRDFLHLLHHEATVHIWVNPEYLNPTPKNPDHNAPLPRLL